MDILNGFTTINMELVGVVSIIKLLFLVLSVGYLIYVFLFTLRVRILADTVKTQNNGVAKLALYAHLLIAVFGTALAVILILVG